MKIVLSRKGFDSGYGGCASPIFPDNTMVSMPIPSESGNNLYSELITPIGKNYAELWADLSNSSNHCKSCHLDPDIRAGIRKNNNTEWIPAFGQIDAAQTHLQNNNISINDIFLFFGWFRKVEEHNGRIRYIKDAENLQVIFGYLQIGKILKGEDVRQCSWHPHSDDSHIYNKTGKLSNNTIYLASDSLIIDGENMKMPGAGTFDFNENLVLTEKGKSRSKWKLNEVFGKINLTYHDKSSVKDGYFQSAMKGQEFIFDEDVQVNNWAKKIFQIQNPD